MKRITKLVLLASFLFCFTSKAFALGCGFQFGGIPGLLINQDEVKLENITVNLTGTFKMERVPLTVGSGLEYGKIFSEYNYGFSLFADYRAVDFQLKNTWNLYSGFGATVKLLTSDSDTWNLSAGARFFAGMNWLFYDGFLEYYVQQNVVPTYYEKDFILCLPFETGLRMHF